MTSSARRGPARQSPQRRRERWLRGHIVELSHWLEEQGWNRDETAGLLNLSPRTLRHWESQVTGRWLLDRPLGRPALRATPERRNEVIALLDELGPALGVPGLRHAFPDLARAELEDILLRYRRVWRRRHYQPLRILHWPVPGSVWAADFAEAPQPIDGRYPYLLAVRDLASGYQLLWLPVEQANSQAVQDALVALFARHGMPLVLKTDNGSCFTAACASLTVQSSSLCRQPFPEVLFSPPYTPAYNGSIEAGIGSLKTRTQAHASRHGHPTVWTLEDVAAAQAEANATARPHGLSGPTPEHLWQSRPELSAEARAQFRTAVDLKRTVLRTQNEGVDSTKVAPMIEHQERALNRQAIRRALEEHGYLLYSRRRIPLPINRSKVTNIR